MREGFKKISMRNRLVLIGCVSVILPLLVLSYFQFWSLVELENKTKDAYKENLRHTLVNTKKNIGNHFEKTFSEMLLPFDQLNLSSPQSREEIKAYFSNVKNTYSEVESISVIKSCNCDKGDGDLSYTYSDNFREIKVCRTHDGSSYHNLIHFLEEAGVKENYLGKNRNFRFFKQKGGDDTGNTYIFYPLKKKYKNAPPIFLTVTLDKQYLKQKLLGEITTAALRDSTSAVSASDLVVRISDENKKTVFASADGKQTYVHKIDFTAPFNKWSAEIGMKNTDIESAARTSFWRNLIMTLSIFGFLVFGLLMTIRATNREVKLAQAKSAFVSNVSHELKTPLSLIRLFSEMLELGYVKSDGKVREYYGVINNESRRLSHLINNILDFSKIESGHRQYDFDYHNVGEVVNEVLSNYKYHIDKIGFEVVTNIDLNTPPAFIDHDAITQAIINLVDNAIKYSLDKQEIHVAVKNHNSHITIEVADFGRGIAKDDHKKIFDKFYRVGDGLIHDVKGSGLGLALVKHIVDAHRGKIWVESTVNKGSRFIFQLPTGAKSEDPKSSHSSIYGGFKIAENLDS